MKKILSTILLTTCLGFPLALAMDNSDSSRSVVPSIQPAISSFSLQQHKETLFKDFDRLNYEIIKQYRQAFQQIEQETEEFTCPTVVEPMACLEPLAREALSYVESLVSEHEHVKVFISEINHRLESGDVTPLWYSLLGLRIQAAISKVSADELNLFNHVIEPGEAILKGLKTKDAWKSHEKSAFLTGEFRTNQDSAHTFHYPLDLDVSAADEALESLEKMLPAQVYYNVFNKKYSGIPFLVHSLINDIYPIALPKTSGKAHGTMLSPLGFSTHDFLHAEADPRRAALEQFVVDELAAQVKLGDQELKSAPIILEHAVKRYQLLNEGLNHLFNYHLTQLNLYHHEAAFKKAMAGYFWILHEEIVFNPDLYKTNNFKDVLKCLADKMPEVKKDTTSEDLSVLLNNTKAATPSSEPDYESWDSPEDFFVTSPITGEPQETDEEIAKKAIDYLKSGKSRFQYVNNDSFTYLIGDNPISKVSCSDRFIDIQVTAKNGHKYRLSFPTLFHKWANMDDHLNLLKYAGIALEKPSIDGMKDREKRSIVIKTLGTVKKALDSLVDDFLDQSLKLVDLKWLEDVSLTSVFQKKGEQLDQEYQEKLKALNIGK